LISFDNRHTGAVAGGMFRQGMAAGSCTDHDQIK
jgi:hypothetical protein